MNAANGQDVTDKGQFNKYFAMMLHIDDDDLDPYEYKLLGHYRKVCGLSQQNVCYEATETTADKAKMSVSKVRAARKELAKKGCITVSESDGRTSRVTIADRMDENLKRYSDNPYQKREGYQKRNPSRKPPIRTTKNVSAELPKMIGDQESKNKKESNTNTSAPVAIAPAQIEPTIASVFKEGQDTSIVPLPEPPKGKAWVSSSQTGTTLAHLVKASNVDRSKALCKASIEHRNRYTPALGPRDPCPVCLKASESTSRKAPEPQSALTKAMHEATPEDIRPPACNYGKNDTAAKACLSAGFTPERVTAFVVATYPTYREWAVRKGIPPIMSMQHVHDYLKAWEAKQVGTPASAASYLDGIPDYGDENPYQSQFKAGSVINSAWQGTIEQLEIQLGKPTFNNRVKGLRLVEVQGDDPKLFIVEACNEFQQQYILKHLMHSLLKTLEDRARCKVSVEVRIGAKAG